MASRSFVLPTAGPRRESVERLILAVMVIAALATIGLAGWAFGGSLIVIALIALLVVGGTALLVLQKRAPAAMGAAGVDWAMVDAALSDAVEAVAITDREGRLVYATQSYVELFGGAVRPDGLQFVEDGADRLGEGVRATWRDGNAQVAELIVDGAPILALLRRGGWRDEHIVWRFRRATQMDPLAFVHSLLASGGADVMLAVGSERQNSCAAGSLKPSWNRPSSCRAAK